MFDCLLVWDGKPEDAFRNLQNKDGDLSQVDAEIVHEPELGVCIRFMMYKEPVVGDVVLIKRVDPDNRTTALGYGALEVRRVAWMSDGRCALFVAKDLTFRVASRFFP